MFIVWNMKGYLTSGLCLLAFCTVVFVTGCSEESGWGAGFGGVPLQQDGPSPVTAGTPPGGSGSVDYVPQGNF
jgi:hypothetical protein